MRVIPGTILSGEDGTLYRGQVVLLGLTGRAHDFVLGTIDAVARNNRHAARACLRGLLETFSAIAWVNNNPDRLLSLLKVESAPSSKKMRDSASTRLDGLEDAWDRWSKTVHPGIFSLFASFTRIEGEDDPAIRRFTFPSPPLEPGEIEEATRKAAELGEYTYRELHSFLEENAEAARAGDPFAELEDDNLVSS